MHCVHPVSLFESHMTHEIHISEDMKCAIFSPTVFIPNILHSNKTSGDLRSSYGCHMRRNGRRFACKRLITAAWFLPEPECSIRFQHSLQYKISSTLIQQSESATFRREHTDMKNLTCAFQLILGGNEPKKISKLSRSCHKSVRHPTKRAGPSKFRC